MLRLHAVAHLMMELRSRRPSADGCAADFIVRTFRPRPAAAAAADRASWAAVEVAAGEFGHPNRPEAGDEQEQLCSALARFDNEFAKIPEELAERLFFVESKVTGNVVGTATCWCDIGVLTVGLLAGTEWH